MKKGTLFLAVMSVVLCAVAAFAQLPDAPERVRFVRPVPKHTLQGELPEVINRGVKRDVTVRVEDRFGNAVRGAHRVEISSANSDLNTAPVDYQIGFVGAPGDLSRNWVNTDPATGIATFSARVDPMAAVGLIFDMTASITLSDGSTSTDVGSLRVGPTLDVLQIFYGDAARGEFDPDSVIDGIAGGWYLITVRAMIGDSVVTSRNQHILVEGTDGLIMASTPGGTPSTVFPMTNGVTTFWVGASSSIQTDIYNGCVLVTALRTSDPADVDESIGSGSRCDIRFVRPMSSIRYAVVYGNGHGVPDSVVLYYAAFNSPVFLLPDSVTLSWPSAANPAKYASVTVPQTNIIVLGDYVLGVSFRGVNSAFAAGRTSIAGNGWGLVRVAGGLAGPTSVEDAFDVIDGIGPVIAKSEDGRDGFISPWIMDNPNRGTVPDALIIQISESFQDEISLEGSLSILYARTVDPNGSPTVGEPLIIARAMPPSGYNTVKLVLAADSYVPEPGDWIRFNPASGVLDYAASSWHDNHPANGPHANNRWVQVRDERSISVLSSPRETPNDVDTTAAAVIAPVSLLTAAFTAGPNPVGRSGVINFYHSGRLVRSGSLTIFDAAGNVVNKITVNDNGDDINNNNSTRRQIATWDLTDRHGRPVAAGAYLARGAITDVNGRRESVSLMIGVR